MATTYNHHQNDEDSGTTMDQSQSDYDEEYFDWNEYLKSTKAEAAPASCFCQNSTPPKNEFRVGHKLETYDPRNTSSTCIGSVIEVCGSRIRLRLDGTDDRNDFWLNVDSDLIHPFEYSTKHGRGIQPPLGFGNDLSKWPKFLEKIISSADENVFAPESCFKTPPTRPPKNEFKAGQKLEAVDPKNPHLICPATIKEINKDKLLITFDGWSQSSQFWSAYNSRDLFPVGWCKLSGHKLQRPGGLETPKLSRTASTIVTPNQNNQSSTAATTTKSSNKNKKTTTTPITTSATATTETVQQTVPPQPPPLNNQSSPNMSPGTSSPSGGGGHLLNSNSSTPTQQINNNNKNKLDLSIVKTEAKEVMPNGNDSQHPQQQQNGSSSVLNEQNPNKQQQHHHNQQQSNITNGNSTTKKQQNHLIHTTTSSATTIIVNVNPSADLGTYIKTGKYHQSHTKFGPGPPHLVFKSILQSFVDCAHDRLFVLALVPEGHQSSSSSSDDYVQIVTQSLNKKKRLISIENLSDMWTHLRAFLKQLNLNADDVFLKVPPLSSALISPKTTTTTTTTTTNSLVLVDQKNIIQKANNQSSTIAAAPVATDESAASNANSAAAQPSSEIKVKKAKISYFSAAKNDKKQLMALTPQTSAEVNGGGGAGVKRRISKLNKMINTNGNAAVVDNNIINNMNMNNINHHHQQQFSSSSESTTPLSLVVINRPTAATMTNGTATMVNGCGGNYHHLQQHQQHQQQPLSHYNKLYRPADQNNEAILPTDWTIDQVIEYINQIGDNNFSAHLEAFRIQEIDGPAFLLLTTEILMKYMGFKLGPALKLNNYIDRLRRSMIAPQNPIAQSQSLSTAAPTASSSVIIENQ